MVSVDRSRGTVGVVVAVLGLLFTIAASLATLAYQAGGIVNGVRAIGVTMEKFDARLGRVETTQVVQGTDIAVIKTQLGAPPPTVYQRGAPRR